MKDGPPAGANQPTALTVEPTQRLARLPNDTGIRPAVAFIQEAAMAKTVTTKTPTIKDITSRVQQIVDEHITDLYAVTCESDPELWDEIEALAHAKALAREMTEFRTLADVTEGEAQLRAVVPDELRILHGRLVDYRAGYAIARAELAYAIGVAVGRRLAGGVQ